uniref:NADH-ubiquinone oxidoreductase chain 4L n=1 Tax=Nautilus macromphalus TaxID=34576 RepID=Q0ZFV9_NAUMA|nr:NADH dehydrogenase subunit 4L [Nautilus macromphalus]ABE26897.1 NADH dehydrogenase subunit 4L [Nautilus macromphalus]
MVLLYSLVLLYFVGYIFGVFVVVMSFKHILNVLLGFEVMMISVYCGFCLLVGSGEVCLVGVLLAFSGCGASLGVGLLVSCIRGHGNDYVSGLSLYKC